jgi:hypothetical protein
MHKLLLQVESKSKAKVLKKSVKHYLVGQSFQVAYKVKNIGDQLFPGGTFYVQIIWPNGQLEGWTYTIPQLTPEETSIAEPKSERGVLSQGFALFYLRNARDNEGKGITLYKSPKDTLSVGNSFYSVLGKEPEELYQYWALIVAIGALLILVGEKVFQTIIWILSLFT